MAHNVEDKKALRFIQDNDQLYEKFQFSYRQPQRELMLYFSTCELEYNDTAQLQMRKKTLEMERSDESLVSLQAYPAYQRAMVIIEDYLKDHNQSS